LFKLILYDYNQDVIIENIVIKKIIRKITGVPVSIGHTWDLTPPQQVEYNKHIEKLKSGYPLDYLIGVIDYGNIRINITEGTFIPRPCTEELVELATDYINNNYDEIDTIYDICSGSGVIGILLAYNFMDKNVVLVEKSANAIADIKSSIKFNNLQNITVIESDVFDTNLDYSNSIVICNPPYVPEADIYESVKYEPKSAIYSGIDGLTFFNKFIKMLSSNLPNQIMFELDPSNIRMASIAISPLYSTNIIKDQDGFPRFLIGTK
jgi:release factor glutamine methyltransferase